MIPRLNLYKRFVLMFSGGKDSLACLLYLLELLDKAGIPRDRVELWHHEVDGREGSTLMDWACTRDYCRKVAEAFNLPIYFSWLEGGFEREMLRENQAKAPTWFETPDGLQKAGGTRQQLSTRRKFPQVSPDLTVRWCSPYLKIDVAAIALNNQKRFEDGKTLVITGERAEESPSRAKYAEFEPHRVYQKYRQIYHWRPVHGWTTQQVWEIIERWGVNPHPAYRIGFGRVSCMNCIFGSSNQFATVQEIAPLRIMPLIQYEDDFGMTIKRKDRLVDWIAKGTPYSYSETDKLAALSEMFDEPIFLPPEEWKLPSGAYAEAVGPS